jgi:3'-phosphoadenosine 5'-phosphosulfate sulfotransferase (PAPS reductase)/FAD synthetase
MKERHVIGLSGGKDSAALAVYMAMHPDYRNLELQYFFSDTGKELPEVYEFLTKLEGVLNTKIIRLGEERFSEEQNPFDHYLKQYGYFLPSPQTRWCTRKLKLDPFKNWIKPWLADGDKIIQYVAIRADEIDREGLWNTNPNIVTKLPFREHGVTKEMVIDILVSYNLGLPKYYEWRSRSGCSFCFFQQKIEWVNLKEKHPDRFEEAKRYEKTAIEHASPFTWSQGESLEELEKPERVTQIKIDFARRIERERSNRKVNPLRAGLEEYEDIDELYFEDEGGGACLVCHK